MLNIGFLPKRVRHRMEGIESEINVRQTVRDTAVKQKIVAGTRWSYDQIAVQNGGKSTAKNNRFGHGDECNVLAANENDRRCRQGCG